MKAEHLSGCTVLWNIITCTLYKPMVKELKKETVLCVERCHHEQLPSRMLEMSCPYTFQFSLTPSNFQFSAPIKKRFKGKCF